MKLSQIAGVVGLAYIPPFSISVWLLTVLQLAVSCGIKKQAPQWHFSAAGPPGLLSGLFWSFGASTLPMRDREFQTFYCL